MCVYYVKTSNNNLFFKINLLNFSFPIYLRVLNFIETKIDKLIFLII